MAAATIIVAGLFVVGDAYAAEEGTFAGTWIASGQRQVLEFLPGREVFTYKVRGHVNLRDDLGKGADYWSECAGLWDAQTGSTGRCVWRGMDGAKVFVVLRGQALEEGIQVAGEVVGGTGSLEGAQGTFTFTWASVFINPDTDTLTGHTENIVGTYRIP
jgi:hypothetical protein